MASRDLAMISSADGGPDEHEASANATTLIAGMASVAGIDFGHVGVTANSPVRAAMEPRQTPWGRYAVGLPVLQFQLSGGQMFVPLMAGARSPSYQSFTVSAHSLMCGVSRW